jgi:hypothetical protein
MCTRAARNEVQASHGQSSPGETVIFAPVRSAIRAGELVGWGVTR